MKQFMILLIAALVSLTAVSNDGKNSSLNERFYKAKVKELTYRLHRRATKEI